MPQCYSRDLTASPRSSSAGPVSISGCVGFQGLLSCSSTSYSCLLSFLSDGTKYHVPLPSGRVTSAAHRPCVRGSVSTPGADVLPR
mmetsp:Transcript_5224/g.8066  ORF Transcript_5224/g.8066 Transcript_5224/m.8066 type:complete len:86 (+) Transcript_5224:157-414(+)